MTEVVVTLKAPALAAFGRSPDSARHASYGRELAAAQDAADPQHPGARSRARRCAGATSWSPTASPSSCPNAMSGRLARTSRASPKVWPNVDLPRARTSERAAGSRSAPTSSGAPTLATAGNGMKIGIIDDGVDATHPFFNPAGFTYPPGLPEGPDQVHDAEGDRPAHVRAAEPELEVRRPCRSTRSTRSTRPMSPASPPATTAPIDEGRSALRGRAEGLSRQLQGADDPDARASASTATRPRSPPAIEAAVADGMNVINLSLGEPEIEPSRDLVVDGDRRGGRRRGRPGRRGRQRLRPVHGYGTVARRRTRRTRSRSRATTTDGEIAELLLRRARRRSRCS